jgi:hypothetical protein
MPYETFLEQLKAARRWGFDRVSLRKKAPDLCEAAGGGDREAGARALERLLDELLAAPPVEHLAQPFLIVRYLCREDVSGSLGTRRSRAAGRFHRSVSAIRSDEDKALVELASLLRNRLEPGGETPRGNRVILLTAHNGTGLSRARAKILDHLAAAGAAIAHVSVDEAFHTAASRHIPALSPAGGPLDPAAQLPALFSHNQRSLHAAWRDGWNSAKGEILALLRNGDVLVTFSASLYHEPSRAIFSPVDNPLVAETFRDARALVVTLVDDIFDTVARISAPGSGEVFDPTNRPRNDDDVLRRSSILRTVLEWRQTEVRAAERLARSLRARHLLVPAKLPLASFARLLAEPEIPACYVSVPITWPRRQEQSGEAMLSWAAQVTDRLRQDPRIALLEAHALDEDRFKTDGSGKVLATELVPRYLGYDRLLAEEPDLVWAGLDDDERALAERPFAPAGPGAGDPNGWPWPDEEPEHLDIVRDEIRNHNVWRNRLLVNQAHQALLILRPYHAKDGQLRGGARIELSVWRDVRAFEERRGRNLQRPRHLVLYLVGAEERLRRRHALVATFYNARSVTLPLTVSGDRGLAAAVMQRVLDAYDELDSRSEAHGGTAARRLAEALLDALGDHAELTVLRAGVPAPTEQFDEDDRAAIGAAIVACIQGDGDTPWTRDFFVEARRLQDESDLDVLCRQLVDVALAGAAVTPRRERGGEAAGA